MILTGIPGADELLGKGVYCGMPKDAPKPVHSRHAVVVGAAAPSIAAARKLRGAGWKVTVVVRERCGDCGMRRDASRRVATELVCATGIEHLEAVALRRMGSKRIEAFNASALFIV